MAEETPTANGTTVAQAMEYAGDDAPSGIRARALLRDAERAVRDIAPPPPDLSGEDEVQYTQDASDAELYVFSAYVANPGYLSSASLDGVSVSFRDVKDGESPVTERVKAIMSRWIRGTPPRATVSAQRYSNVLTEKDKW